MLFRALAFSILVVAAVPSFAHAQEAAPASARDEARTRFDRGVELFGEERYDAALAEFQRANELAPSPTVAYNLGRVHGAMGHAVESVAAYEKYLHDGGAQISASRRAEVERELARQRSRIAFIDVHANISGATIALDGVDVATTPLHEPLHVSAGSHTVGVRAPGYDSTTRAVQLAGGVTETVDVSLVQVVARHGTIRVDCPLHDVEVRLDGEIIGRTPLDHTLAVEPGEHLVSGTRPGYTRVRRQVDVEDGAETVAVFEMNFVSEHNADDWGKLALHLPSGAATLHVDGQPLPVEDEIDLPVGPHTLDIEITDRVARRESVTIHRAQTAQLSPTFEWTAEARAHHAGSSQAWRVVGWSAFAAGAIVAIVGGVELGMASSKVKPSEDAAFTACQRALQAYQHSLAGSGTWNDATAQTTVGMDCFDGTAVANNMIANGSFYGASGMTAMPYSPGPRYAAYEAALQSRSNGQTLGGILLGAGLAVSVTGLIIALTSSDSNSSGSSGHAATDPTFNFGVTPGGVQFGGTF